MVRGLTLWSVAQLYVILVQIILYQNYGRIQFIRDASLLDRQFGERHAAFNADGPSSEGAQQYSPEFGQKFKSCTNLCCTWMTWSRHRAIVDHGVTPSALMLHLKESKCTFFAYKVIALLLRFLFRNIFLELIIISRAPETLKPELSPPRVRRSTNRAT